jgi:hypothetical protein
VLLIDHADAHATVGGKVGEHLDLPGSRGCELEEWPSKSAGHSGERWRRRNQASGVSRKGLGGIGMRAPMPPQEGGGRAPAPAAIDEAIDLLDVEGASPEAGARRRSRGSCAPSSRRCGRGRLSPSTGRAPRGGAHAAASRRDEAAPRAGPAWRTRAACGGVSEHDGAACRQAWYRVLGFPHHRPVRAARGICFAGWW